MPFTAEEIQTAVESLVRANVRRPYGTLGERDTEVTFADFQEAIAGVFLLNGKAPFYIAYLGTRRLLEDVKSEKAAVDLLVSYLRVFAGRTVNVTDVTALSEMKAALVALDTAMSGRSEGFRSLQSVPAFQRFSAAVSSFLSGPADGLRVNGDVGPSPEEIRELVPELLTELEEIHAEVVRKTKQLMGAIAEYSGLNLATRVSRTVISRARKKVDSHVQSLSSQSAQDRAKALRGVTLDVLASNALIKGFGQFSAPVEQRTFEGVAVPFADDGHPVIPSSVVADKVAPYVVEAGKSLEFLVDGSSTPVVVELEPSFVAQMVSTLSEADSPSPGMGPGGVPLPGGFNIHLSGLGGLPSTQTFTIKVDGVSLSANLIVDPNKTAQAIVNELNGFWSASHNITFFTEGEVGAKRVGVRLNAFDLSRSLEIEDSGANAVLGFVPGYVWKCQATTAEQLAKDITAKQTKILATTTFVDVEEVTARTEVNSVGIIRRRGSTEMIPDALDPEYVVVYLGDPTGLRVGDLVTITTGPNAGSWVINALSTDPFSGSVITKDGVISGTYDALADYTITTTTPATLSRVSTYGARGTANMTVALDGAVTFTPVDIDLSTLPMPEQVIVRSGINTQTLWNVSSAGATTITATSPSKYQATAETGVEIELLYSTMGSEGDSLRITDSTNKGTYSISKAYVGPLDQVGSFDITPTLVAERDGDTQIPLFMSAVIGEQAVQLVSRQAGPSNRLEVVASASGFNLLWNGSTNKVATSLANWLSLPEGLRQIEVGDLVRYFGADYASPSQESEVVALSGNLAKITPGVPTEQTWDFSASLVPFARIADGTFVGYKQFQDLATTWLSWLDTVSPTYFYDVRRVVGSALNNSQPSEWQTRDARVLLSALSNILTVEGSGTPQATLERAIQEFTMSPEGDVDTVLRALREKGCDRAVDILLEGRFSEFFSMDSEDVSYAGAMVKAVREIGREDLPIRKVGRKDTLEQRSLGSAASPDFEFDQSDIDNSPNVQIPEEG